MSANLENSAVATGLEKVSFHPNLKERQCQRMKSMKGIEWRLLFRMEGIVKDFCKRR